MTSLGRMLPLRVPVAPGEPLDSWLEALARRNQTTVTTLAPALGWQLPGTPGGLIDGIPDAVLRRIEHQAGLSPGRLDAAALDRHLPLGTVRRDGSRYCPACLSDREGRWLLSWRLPWTFACTTHRLLLRDTCPGCGRLPRARTGPAGLNPPGTCAAATPRHTYCGADLREAAARRSRRPARQPGHQRAAGLGTSPGLLHRAGPARTRPRPDPPRLRQQPCHHRKAHHQRRRRPARHQHRPHPVRPRTHPTSSTGLGTQHAAGRVALAAARPHYPDPRVLRPRVPPGRQDTAGTGSRDRLPQQVPRRHRPRARHHPRQRVHARPDRRELAARAVPRPAAVLCRHRRSARRSHGHSDRRGPPTRHPVKALHSAQQA